MKKLDSLTLIGLFLGLIMLIWGMSSSAGIKMFFDLPSLMITIGGSFCALLINYSIDEIKKIGKIFMASTREMSYSKIKLLKHFTSISKKARREGLLSLEKELSTMEDEFLKNGLRMVIDGIEPETIKEIMDLEIDEVSERHIKAANIFKTWGGYAPAFGMIGTLLGLVKMLGSLSDTSTLASGMAKALMATFYGAVLAYAILNPIAANLNVKNEKEISAKEMILEGILAIQSGVNPRIIEQKLINYLSPEEKLEYSKGNLNSEGAFNQWLGREEI
ncbi:motility protein A [Clostridium manihotivorum]|uniref:Motility protein A n=1 Tax=Clostridium manihotivorum TaxID=2320868 RepID=A0A3R5QXB6_9CLOT|nr:motility protein A [Clostridium manihotivorum]QAA31683.1 motility protein A [Clostridium manihotivorum]